MPEIIKYSLISLCLATIAGCGGTSYVYDDEQDSAPADNRDLSSVPDAVPQNESRSRYGNPPSYVVLGKRYFVKDSSSGYVERGIASWYGTKFHGRRTSSGERYDMYAMTAAHKSLPLPTYLEVINLENGRKVIVKANDRGPFHDNRLIDLSYSAAYRLGILGKGTGLVEIRAIDLNAPEPEPEPEPVLAKNEPATASSTEPGNPNIYLQVGAFISRTNAESMQSKLLNAALGKALISPLKRASDTVYRVRLGPIANVEDADQLVGKLAALGIVNANIVID